jgi:hypothetical protein
MGERPEEGGLIAFNSNSTTVPRRYGDGSDYGVGSGRPLGGAEFLCEVKNELGYIQTSVSVVVAAFKEFQREVVTRLDALQADAARESDYAGTHSDSKSCDGPASRDESGWEPNAACMPEEEQLAAQVRIARGSAGVCESVHSHPGLVENVLGRLGGEALHQCQGHQGAGSPLQGSGLHHRQRHVPSAHACYP